MRRFRTLRVQLLLSHLILVVLMAIVMASAVSSFLALGHSIDSVLKGTFGSVVACERMNDVLERKHQAITLLITGQTSLALQEYQQTSGELNEALAEIELNASPEDAERVAELRVSLKRFQDQLTTVFRNAKEMPREDLLHLYHTKVRPAAADLQAKLQTIQAIDQEAIQSANDRAKEQSQQAATRSLVETLIALILAILLAFRMIRMALTPLEQLAKKAKAIGSGDLDQRIEFKRSDEIGAVAQAFNGMAESLSDMRSKEARRLRRAELMSDAALDSLYDPVIVSDAQGRLVYLNRAAQGLFGPTPPVPRMPVVEHIGDRRIVRAIQNAITEDRVSAGEDPTTHIPLKVEGAERIYRLRATPMKDENGQLVGSVTVLEDITHLRELDRMKTEFIGVASHELRTPVTSMLLSVQLLEEGAAGKLTGAQREIISAQREDVERLDHLMRELLDISRLEAGTAPPRFEILPAEDLLRAAVRTSQAQAAQKGVALEMDAAASLPLVRADKSQIGRVLTNLVTNAIRHTEPGGRITLRASGGTDQVTFAVEDTGSGIPKDYREHIFERFVQVPGATGGGAGLGLSISRTIVQAHGGEMCVESELGQGSTFSFSLRTDQHSAEGEEEK